MTHATWHYEIRYPLPSLLPFKIDIFLAGMLVAQCCREGRGMAMTLLVLALILAFEPFQGEGSLERVVVREIMVLVFFGLVLHRLLPAALGNCARKVSSALGNNPFHWLGEISYSTYLLHMPLMLPVLEFVILHWGHGISPVTRFVIVFLVVSAIVYPLSWLTYRYIEVPGQAAGRAILRRITGKSIDAREERAEGIAAP
jgi:peptidoglycan/LPS O-acetylase OafA/YrhL